MFDVGQNDIYGAFSSKSEDEVLAFIPTILSEFETEIKVVIYVVISKRVLRQNNLILH